MTEVRYMSTSAHHFESDGPPRPARGAGGYALSFASSSSSVSIRCCTLRRYSRASARLVASRSITRFARRSSTAITLKSGSAPRGFASRQAASRVGAAAIQPGRAACSRCRRSFLRRS